ncbi:MAG: serine kinase [Cyanomargarita calcarea GSE-NOS-MK-12-04C]|jgi:hypothetical protein|uniref:Serine kinase n=1 Tax=Cyanomargarita calcarea GSE-NOS-MK-12-04C TaxID=2839659 RepID=A0A951QLD4_9CYAN|nr:serine kinase [Cyanomargarita calcarea GSE-NOS-MK-12-04C]
MYFYHAYGLNIQSALSLPELNLTIETKADVVIKLGIIDDFPFEVNPSEIFREHISLEKSYFFWNQIGKFLVQNGTEIVIEPLPKIEERSIRLPLLGTIMAVLLHQRGLLVLHASAVAINDGVVAFLGNKGQGKSTMAATLYGRGHHLMADDLVVIKFSDSECPFAIPGFPQFKLWPSSAIHSLGDNPETLPQLATGYEKRARRVVDRFLEKPMQLKRIYVLSEGLLPKITPIQPQEAIVQLIINSYVSRFGNKLFQGAAASLHLAQCTNLIKNVPVSSLERPLSFSFLSEVAKLVEKDSLTRMHQAATP